MDHPCPIISQQKSLAPKLLSSLNNTNSSQQHPLSPPAVSKEKQEKRNNLMKYIIKNGNLGKDLTQTVDSPLDPKLQASTAQQQVNHIKDNFKPSDTKGEYSQYLNIKQSLMKQVEKHKQTQQARQRPSNVINSRNITNNYDQQVEDITPRQQMPKLTTKSRTQYIDSSHSTPNLMQMEEYPSRVKNLQDKWASPMTKINESTKNSSYLRQRSSSCQKVENRLINSRQRKEQNLKILKTKQMESESQQMQDKPLINPQSHRLLNRQQPFSHSDLYTKEVQFLQKKEEQRQKLASQLLRLEDEKIILSPKINQRSQSLRRKIKHLHDWEMNAKLKKSQMKSKQVEDEVRLLQRMRDAPKGSKYNGVYLENNKYYSMAQSSSLSKSPTRVEDRLINFGSLTKNRIASQRETFEKEVKRRMNSPSINKRSQNPKYKETPFHERLYTLKNSISPRRGDFIEPVEEDDIRFDLKNRFCSSSSSSYQLAPQSNRQVTDNQFTPLRQGRQPTYGSRSKSRSTRKNIDYNANYKKTFQKNVLLKEWQYTSLYNRQLLSSGKRDQKSQHLQQETQVVTFTPRIEAHEKAHFGGTTPFVLSQPGINYSQMYKTNASNSHQQQLLRETPTNDYTHYNQNQDLNLLNTPPLNANLAQARRNLINDYYSWTISNQSPPRSVATEQEAIGMGDEYYKQMYNSERLETI